MEIREVTYVAIAVRIVVALLLGGVIGLERGLKHRPAGLRTYMLVCVGACLIMLTNQYVYQVYQVGDPVRMGAQVVNGIGFLGAGTIIVTKRNQIKGLTTAAGLWASAAVGLAIGIGLYEAALLGGGSIFLILTVLQRLDDRMHHNTKMLEIYIELTKAINLGNFIRQLREMELEINSIQLEHDNTLEDGVRAYIVSLKSKQKKKHEDIFQGIRAIDGVAYLDEL